VCTISNTKSPAIQPKASPPIYKHTHQIFSTSNALRQDINQRYINHHLKHSTTSNPSFTHVFPTSRVPRHDDITTEYKHPDHDHLVEPTRTKTESVADNQILMNQTTESTHSQISKPSNISLSLIHSNQINKTSPTSQDYENQPIVYIASTTEDTMKWSKLHNLLTALSKAFMTSNRRPKCYISNQVRPHNSPPTYNDLFPP
jgi:hypothetical protein